jgi:hypothetical protein
MKKIINGFRYNTETAILIGKAGTFNLGMSDFNYWQAGLYKTKRSNNYFMAGEGHAMTRFADHSGGSSGWGRKLIPMTREEAFKWAQEFLDTEDIEKEFSDMIKEG